MARKRGQPTKYKPEYCEMLIDHMEAGYSFPSFSAVINVNPDSLYEWAKVHPEFSDAKKRGYMKSLMVYERMGKLGINGKIKNFNVTAWIFSMKNKFGWRDRVENISQQKEEYDEPESLK